MLSRSGVSARKGPTDDADLLVDVEQQVVVGQNLVVRHHEYLRPDPAQVPDRLGTEILVREALVAAALRVERVLESQADDVVQNAQVDVVVDVDQDFFAGVQFRIHNLLIVFQVQVVEGGLEGEFSVHGVDGACQPLFCFLPSDDVQNFGGCRRRV